MRDGLQTQDGKEGQRISNPSLPKRFLTLKEAAFYMARGVYGVRELIWAGKLPIIREGRNILLDREDIDSYMVSLKEKYIMRQVDERPKNGRRKNHVPA